VIVLEGLLRSGVGEPAIAEVVEVGDQAAELTALDPNRIKLILVVLRERTGEKTQTNQA
jgi:hypothetical protein